MEVGHLLVEWKVNQKARMPVIWGIPVCVETGCWTENGGGVGPTTTTQSSYRVWLEYSVIHSIIRSRQVHKYSDSGKTLHVSILYILCQVQQLAYT